ncbi:hypothetical protein CSOJ01_06240 [Colletotrichum sojae]|uniref:Uncharacterized protein n=1 Tax=Colletotrichum sojae TaxID=2175907 RepID=A0A8H6JDF6_9PEZI|nr:hypothetical protein CSOJ01_06240 [Colletotrichum sojae]
MLLLGSKSTHEPLTRRRKNRTCCLLLVPSLGGGEEQRATRMREASPESVRQAVVEAANEWSSQRRRNCNSKQRPKKQGESEYAMGADGIMRRRAEISQSSSRSGSRVVAKVVERAVHTDGGPDQQTDVDSSQARDKGANGIAKQVDLPGGEVGRDDRLHVHLDRQGPLPSV